MPQIDSSMARGSERARTGVDTKKLRPDERCESTAAAIPLIGHSPERVAASGGGVRNIRLS